MKESFEDKWWPGEQAMDGQRIINLQTGDLIGMAATLHDARQLTTAHNEAIEHARTQPTEWTDAQVERATIAMSEADGLCWENLNIESRKVRLLKMKAALAALNEQPKRSLREELEQAVLDNFDGHAAKTTDAVLDVLRNHSDELRKALEGED